MSEFVNDSSAEELVETVTTTVDDSTVVTVPIDDTLSVEGEAADAKAVGDALALKADADATLSSITIDGQESDNQGVIVLLAEHIPVDDSENADSIADVLADLDGKTAADIPMSSAQGSQSVSAAITALQGKNAANLPMSETDTTTIREMIRSLFPVGSIYMTTSATAPAFFGTWTEIKITATWNDLKNNNRGYVEGTGSGAVHYWLRTA